MAIPKGPTGPLCGADISMMRQLLLEGGQKTVEERMDLLTDYIARRRAQAEQADAHKRMDRAGFDRQEKSPGMRDRKEGGDDTPPAPTAMTTGSGPA